MQIVDKIFLILALLSTTALGQTSQGNSFTKVPSGVQFSFKDGSAKVLGNSRINTKIEYLDSSNTTCSAGTCGVTSKSSGISTIVNQGVGAYLMTFTSGTWASPPVCMYNSLTRAVASHCESNGVCTASVCNILCQAPSAVTNDNPSVICVGLGP